MNRIILLFLLFNSTLCWGIRDEMDPLDKQLDLKDVETPKYSETIVDDTYEFVTKKVWLLSNTLDAFFTDAPVNEEKNPGNARIWYEYFNEKGEEIIFRPDFRLRIYMRKTRKLLRFNLTNTSIQQENSSRVDQSQVDGATRSSDKKISASVTKDVKVSRFYRFSSSVGARVDWPLNTYIRLKNKFNKKLGRINFYGNLDVYYYRQTMLGSVFNLNLTGRAFKELKWRLHQFYNFEGQSTNTYGVGYQLIKTWDDANLTTFQTGFNGIDHEGGHIIDEYYLAITWRHRLYNKWLFFEASPNIKAKNKLSWGIYPGIYAKLELLFGDF